MKFGVDRGIIIVKKRQNGVGFVPKITQALKRYWSDTATNIFRNYIDALLGTVILIMLPGASLVFALTECNTTWGNYVFPIMSICLAGAYDTYGRYEPGSPKNIKLGIRLVIDFLALILALTFVGQTELVFRAAAPALLLLEGSTIMGEVYWRVKTAIELSPWYSR